MSGARQLRRRVRGRVTDRPFCRSVRSTPRFRCYQYPDLIAPIGPVASPSEPVLFWWWWACFARKGWEHGRRNPTRRVSQAGQDRRRKQAGSTGRRRTGRASHPADQGDCPAGTDGLTVCFLPSIGAGSDGSAGRPWAPRPSRCHPARPAGRVGGQFRSRPVAPRGGPPVPASLGSGLCPDILDSPICLRARH